jgi:hypothetical protein
MLGFRRGGIWGEEYDCDELSVFLVVLAMERGAPFPLAERGSGAAAGGVECSLEWDADAGTLT